MADFASAPDTRNTAVALTLNTVTVFAVMPLAADFRAVAVALTIDANLVGFRSAGNVWTPSAPVPAYVYKMRGMDAAVVVLNTWLSPDAPDYVAARYTGTLTRPLRDVVVIDSVGDDMTAAVIALVACTAAAVSGCVCTCVSAGASKFESACLEQDGRVQTLAASKLCVADAGVIATWAVDDDDAGGD